MVDHIVTPAEGSARIESLVEGGVSPGDAVLVEFGTYGSWDVKGSKGASYTPAITVKAADPNNPPFFSGRIKTEDARGVHLEHLEVTNPSTANGSECINFLSSDDVSARHCKLRGGNNGIEAFGCDGVVIAENNFGDHTADAIKFGGIHNFLIENNFDTGTRNLVDPQAHLDFIQGQTSSNSSNGTIRGNVLLGHDIPNKVIQGIFLDDGSYTDVTIEYNLIYTNAGRGVKVFQGSNVLIRENTVLGREGASDETTIDIDTPLGPITIERNVAHSGAGVGGLTVARTEAAYATVYQSVAGNTAVIEDFRPVPGGPADFGSGIGAEKRIAELLNAGEIPGMSFTYTVETAPDAAVGTLTIDNPATGDATFTPATDAVGNTSFQYRKQSDIFGNHAIGTIQVNVVPPTVIAPDGNLTVDANTPKVFNLETAA